MIDNTLGVFIIESVHEGKHESGSMNCFKGTLKEGLRTRIRRKVVDHLLLHDAAVAKYSSLVLDRTLDVSACN